MKLNKTDLTNRRKPILSIVISSDNNYEQLIKCVNSFLPLNDKMKNIEFIIINNFSQNIKVINNIKKFIVGLNLNNLIFYQANQKLTSSQMKNLGIDFISGNWIFFVDYFEEATSKFISFLQNFKFDIYQDFYRISILDQNHKKIRNRLFWQNKYFETTSSTIIFNQEYIEKHNIRWENSINYNDTLVVLSKIYSTLNVNYVYLTNHYSVIHNYNICKHLTHLRRFEDILKIYEALLRNKDKNYKQFIIILFFNYLNRIYDSKLLYSNQSKEIKKYLKIAKIRYYNYFNLGIVLFIKTLKFRWITRF